MRGEATERLADEKQQDSEWLEILICISRSWLDHLHRPHGLHLHVRHTHNQSAHETARDGECWFGEAFDKSKNNEILIMSSLEIELLGHAIDLHALEVVIPLDFLPTFLSMRTFLKIFDLTTLYFTSRDTLNDGE